MNRTPRKPTEGEIAKAIEVLKSASHLEIQRQGFHFQANDFYSPLNDCQFLRENEDLWKQRPALEIDWRKASQLEVARTVGGHVEELRDVPDDYDPRRLEYCWNNFFWNNADALVQYGLVRSLRPKRYVEVGCGWSSLLLARALEANGGECQVTQVEPYPNEVIFAELPKEWERHRAILQRVDFGIFENLQAGDVLFYDGSHCAKAGSDVGWFFFEILPRLAPGVVIHLHDIFLPDPYPDDWIFERGQTWNEQEVLRAFLMHNRHYEILIANRYLFLEEAELLASFYRDVQPAHGCSFWMRKLQ